MKISLSVAMLFGFTAALPAQTTNPRFGVGVSLDMTPTSGFNLGGGLSFDARTGNIHFPFRVSRSIRIEPMLGYTKETQELTIGTTTETGSFSLLRVGIGFIFLMPRGSSFQAYTGPRLGMRRRSEKLRLEDTSFPPAQITSLKQNDIFISGVFGGEYFLAQRFSLGGEAQLTYTDFGNIDVTQSPPNPNPGPTPKVDGSRMETAGSIVVRWYP